MRGFRCNAGSCAVGLVLLVAMLLVAMLGIDQPKVPAGEQTKPTAAPMQFVEVRDAFERDRAPWFRSPFDAIATDMDLDGDPDLLINWHHHERLELLENQRGRFVLRNPPGADRSGLYDNRGVVNLFADERKMKQRIAQSKIAGLHLWHDLNRGGFWRLLWHDPDPVVPGDQAIVHLESTLPIAETTGIDETSVTRDGERKLSFAVTDDDRSRVLGVRVRRVATGLTLRLEPPESGRAVPIFVGANSSRAVRSEVHLWKPDPHGIAWLDVVEGPRPDLYITRGGLGGELKPPAEPKRDRFYVALAGDGPRYRSALKRTIPASYGRGRRVEWVDVDGDGDLELSISNEKSPNELLMRDGSSGDFVDEATRFGLALERGDVQAWGDLEPDGRPDLFYLAAGRIDVLRNTGGAQFERVSGDDLGLKVPDFEDGPGVIDPAALQFVDFDNDGDLDLCLSAFGKSGRLRLFRNDSASDDARFVDVSERLGLSTLEGVRIAAFEDFDGDSFVDLVLFGTHDRFGHNQRGRSFEWSPLVAGKKGSRTAAAAIGDFNGDRRPDLVAIGKQRRLILNTAVRTNDRLIVTIRATPDTPPDTLSDTPARSPVGALVRAHYADGTIRAQRYGSSRNSAFSQALQPLHFGSPHDSSLQFIGVRWPGETEELRTAVSAGTSHLVLERPR